MPTLSGETNRERALLVHAAHHWPIVDVAVIAGAWSADVPADQPFYVIYISPDCPPEIHGPYST